MEYLRKPILPGYSIGGIRLGTTDYTEISLSTGEYATGPPYREGLEPRMIYPGLELRFEEGRDHGVTELRAMWGYLGVGPKEVSVGLDFDQLRNRFPDLQYSSERQLWYAPNLEGIYFAIGEFEFARPGPLQFEFEAVERYEPGAPRLNEATVLEVVVRTT